MKQTKGRVLPAELVRQLWLYDPALGDLIWRVPYGKFKKGDVAQIKKPPRKYGPSPIWVVFGAKTYAAHNLIWVYVTGSPPKGEVDHEDRDPSNNRWDNLRDSTRSQNQANRRLFRNNNTGVRGVHWVGTMGRWRAVISENGKNRHLGYYNTIEDAGAAWKVAALIQHGEFAAVR